MNGSYAVTKRRIQCQFTVDSRIHDGFFFFYQRRQNKLSLLELETRMFLYGHHLPLVRYNFILPPY